MSQQYLQLGSIDLSKNVRGEIKQDGGYLTIAQDGPVSLSSTPRKGAPIGTKVSFSVVFDVEADADAFRLYCSSEEAIDAPLYLRDANWYLRVLRIALKASKIPPPSGYLQYCYDVVCYAEGPYCYAATSKTVTLSELKAISVNTSEVVIVVDSNGTVWECASATWSILDITFEALDVSISDAGEVAAVSAADGLLYIWSGSAWARHSADPMQLEKICHTNYAGSYPFVCVGSSNQTYRWNTNPPMWISLGQTAKDIAAEDWYYVAVVSLDGKIRLLVDSWADVGGTPSNAVAVACPDQGRFLLVDSDGKLKLWTSPSTWTEIGQSGKIYNDVDCGDSHLSAWAITADLLGHFMMAPWPYGIWGAAIGHRTARLDNSTGHVAEHLGLSFACDATAHTLAITMAIGGETLIICDEALSGEVWELFEEFRLQETYEDTFANGAKWALDTVGDGSFDTDHIDLVDGEEAYYTLSGPHPAQKPVIMTAELSGTGYVEVYEAGAWRQVIGPAQIQSGQAVYSLSRTEFMTDILVRLNGPLQINYIKFEVEREIQDDVPSIPAGQITTATISASSGSMDVTGSFTPRRRV